ncbi:MAG: hypothetical protein FWD17_03555 [Polyangiaceae bacterium]|nr:hypothetical protein [Polyangiaceae bacterium]
MVALALAAIGAAVAVAFAIAWRGGAAAATIPTRASTLVAWSAGILIAVGGALRAVPADADEGVVALLRARGVSANAYVRGRVGGLVVVIAAGVGGAVAASVVAALLAAPRRLEAAHSGLAALVYVAAFAATIGPVAMATLATRSRAAGYITFIAVIVVPEIAARWTTGLLPRGWHELTSIRTALAAVQEGVLAPAEGGLAMARAALALAAVAVVALAVVHTRIPHVGGGDAA